MTNYTSNCRETIKSIYTYDKTSGSETATFYNSKNKFLAKWIVKFDKAGRVIKSCLYDSVNTLCKKSAYKYDAHGRETERSDNRLGCERCNMLTNILSDEPEEGIDWCFPVNSGGLYTSVTSDKHEYDRTGRLMNEKKIRFDIIYGIAQDSTIEITVYQYGNSYTAPSDVKKLYIRVHNGTGDTTSEITDKYDNRGNKAEEDYLKHGSRPPLKNGYGDGKKICKKTLYTYDIRNNLVEEKEYLLGGDDCLDNDDGLSDSYGCLPHGAGALYHYNDGNPNPQAHSGTKIGSGCQYTYDFQNNMVAHNFYYLYKEANGSETKDVRVSWTDCKKTEVRKEYDKQGNVIKATIGGIVLLRREIECF